MDILHKYGVFYLMDYKDGSFLFCLEWPDTAKQKQLLLYKISKTCSCARNFAVLPFF